MRAIAARSWWSERVHEFLIPNFLIPAAGPEKVWNDLNKIKTGVADDRRGCGAAAQVHGGPERAEQAGGDRGVDALEQMSGAEPDAGHHQADDRTPQPDFEAVQQKRALDLLSETTGDEHDQREQPRIVRRPHQIL